MAASRPTIGWVRVALAIFVMLFHYGISPSITHSLLETHPQWRPHLVYAGDGNLAVIGFFVISGFLVAQVVRERHDPSRLDHLLRFTFSRYLRLWPLYAMLFVAFSTICVLGMDRGAVPHDPTRIASWLFLLPAGISSIAPQSSPLYAQVVPVFWGAVWTLALDFLFYPLGFLLMRKTGVVAPLLGLLLLGQSVFMFWMPLYAPVQPGQIQPPFGSSWNVHYYTTMPSMFLPFVAGMWARLKAYERDRPWNPLIAAVCVIGLFWTLEFPWNIPPFAAATLCTIFFTLLVSELSRNGQSAREAAMGHFTYALYLTHQFVSSPFLAPLAGYWLGVRFEGSVIDRWRRHLLSQPWTRFSWALRTMPSSVSLIPFGITAMAILSMISSFSH